MPGCARRAGAQGGRAAAAVAFIGLDPSGRTGAGRVGVAVEREA